MMLFVDLLKIHVLPSDVSPSHEVHNNQEAWIAFKWFRFKELRGISERLAL